MQAEQNRCLHAEQDQPQHRCIISTSSAKAAGANLANRQLRPNMQQPNLCSTSLTVPELLTHAAHPHCVELMSVHRSRHTGHLKPRSGEGGAGGMAGCHCGGGSTGPAAALWAAGPLAAAGDLACGGPGARAATGGECGAAGRTRWGCAGVGLPAAGTELLALGTALPGRWSAGACAGAGLDPLPCPAAAAAARPRGTWSWSSRAIDASTIP
jgi:hypothetical protein